MVQYMIQQWSMSGFNHAEPYMENGKIILFHTLEEAMDLMNSKPDIFKYKVIEIKPITF